MSNKIIWDIPLVTLLFSNIILILFAILLNWDFDLVFFLYWIQSIIIFISICIKIILSKNLKNGFIKIHSGNRTIVSDMSNIFERVKGAIFLFIVILCFMLFILVFFFVGLEIDFFAFLNKNFYNLVLGVIIFLFCHLISLIFFIVNQSDLENLMEKFTDRLFSMGLFICLFGILFLIFPQRLFLLVIFMIIKTYFDVLTHAQEHGNVVDYV